MFKAMSSRRPQDLLKKSYNFNTISGKIKEPPGVKGPPIYGRSIYVRYDLLTCYHSITRQTN